MVFLASQEKSIIFLYLWLNEESLNDKMSLISKIDKKDLNRTMLPDLLTKYSNSSPLYLLYIEATYNQPTQNEEVPTQNG